MLDRLRIHRFLSMLASFGASHCFVIRRSLGFNPYSQDKFIRVLFRSTLAPNSARAQKSERLRLFQSTGLFQSTVDPKTWIPFGVVSIHDSDLARPRHGFYPPQRRAALGMHDVSGVWAARFNPLWRRTTPEVSSHGSEPNSSFRSTHAKKAWREPLMVVTQICDIVFQSTQTPKAWIASSAPAGKSSHLLFQSTHDHLDTDDVI